MLSVSHAARDDVEIIAEIHAYCWREAYSFMPEEVLKNRTKEYRLKQWMNWFSAPKENDALLSIRNSGKIVGFCFCCKNQDGDLKGADGELHAAYVLPQYRGGAVGPLMMLAMVRHLANEGLVVPGLWAFKQNSIRFWYAQMGWRSVIKRDRLIVGKRLPEVGYICRDVPALEERLYNLLNRQSFSTALIQNQLHSLKTSGPSRSDQHIEFQQYNHTRPEMLQRT